MGQFVEYIKERKSVALEDLAAQFGLRVQVNQLCLSIIIQENPLLMMGTLPTATHHNFFKFTSQMICICIVSWTQWPLLHAMKVLAIHGEMRQSINCECTCIAQFYVAFSGKLSAALSTSFVWPFVVLIGRLWCFG